LFISSQPRVLEFVAPRVERERLHDSPAALRKLLEHHALFLDRREIVGRGPVLSHVLGAPVEMVGLERLERYRPVAEIFKPQLVEIVATEVDVEILSPIVLHPLVDDGAAGDEVLDAVGGVAERRLERGRADVALATRRVGPLPPSLR
jgi:hypothetical protein